MTVQRWSPDGSTMIAVPNGRFVLATDYDALERRLAEAERYVAGQDVRSDFATAAEMRAELDAANRRLALAVEEVKAWRAWAKHPDTYLTKCASMDGVFSTRSATNADPELAKMIGGA